jgi:hypothetical protein
MSRELFMEYANEVSVTMAIELARCRGVPAAMINEWLDELEMGLFERA